jgi:hypothetical protein
MEVSSPSVGISIQPYSNNPAADGWDLQNTTTAKLYGGFATEPTTVAEAEAGTEIYDYGTIVYSQFGTTSLIEYTDSSMVVGGVIPVTSSYYYAVVTTDAAGNKSLSNASYVPTVVDTFRSLGINGSISDPVLGGTFPGQVTIDTYSYFYVQGGSAIELTAQYQTGLTPLASLNTEGQGYYEIPLPPGLDFANTVTRTSGITPTGATVLGDVLDSGFFNILYIYQYSGPNHPTDSFDGVVTVHAGPTGMLLRITANSSQTHPAGGNVGWWSDQWGKVVPSESTAYGLVITFQVIIPVQSI